MHGETYLTTKNATSGTRGEPGHLDELDRDAAVRGFCQLAAHPERRSSFHAFAGQRSPGFWPNTTTPAAVSVHVHSASMSRAAIRSGINTIGALAPAVALWELVATRKGRPFLHNRRHSSLWGEASSEHLTTEGGNNQWRRSGSVPGSSPASAPSARPGARDSWRGRKADPRLPLRLV
jgi:hypothetical protein